MNAAEGLLVEVSDREPRARFVLADAELSPLLERISACALGLRERLPTPA